MAKLDGVGKLYLEHLWVHPAEVIAFLGTQPSLNFIQGNTSQMNLKKLMSETDRETPHHGCCRLSLKWLFLTTKLM